MQMDCNVTRDENEVFVLDFCHPLNSVKGPLESETSKDLMICVRLSPDHMTGIGKDTFSTMKKTNVKVFGRLLDFDRDSAIATVRPISVY